MTIAALDVSDATGPVLEEAVLLGEMTHTEVQAVHVTRGPADPVELLVEETEEAGVPLRLLEPPIEGAFTTVVEGPEVHLVVIGERGSVAGRRPMGRTTRHILEHVTSPVVVVPPEATSCGEVRRFLVPLEGTSRSSRPIIDRVCPLLTSNVELLVLHVFNEMTTPTMLDHPGYDLDIIGREFLIQYCPDASRIELRSGRNVAARVTEVCRNERVDLVALSWSQDLSPGRAQVVRGILSASQIPVLLLPLHRGEIGG
ncbi:MAG: hypothetical protein ACLQPH_20785 [Acidimicrobiales bacterium]